MSTIYNKKNELPNRRTIMEGLAISHVLFSWIKRISQDITQLLHSDDFDIGVYTYILYI